MDNTYIFQRITYILYAFYYITKSEHRQSIHALILLFYSISEDSFSTFSSFTFAILAT